MNKKIGNIFKDFFLVYLLLRLRNALQLRVQKVFMVIIFLALATGCEPNVIKFTIVSQSGETHFAVPAEMMPKCCRPAHKISDFASIDLDPKILGGKGYYHIDLSNNDNNNSLITKTLPDLVAAAEETVSEFSGYKKYIQHKNPEADFLLVGQEKSGKKIYIQCAKLIHPRTKCTYYDTLDAKISYEFMFPIAQLDNLENLIVYAQTQITHLIVKE